MTYLERYNVDINGWDLSSFKTPLDFNLNTKFNLNNVLIFTKFYTYYHQCTLQVQIK